MLYFHVHAPVACVSIIRWQNFAKLGRRIAALSKEHVEL
jgi:hypothetical protein